MSEESPDDGTKFLAVSEKLRDYLRYLRSVDISTMTHKERQAIQKNLETLSEMIPPLIDQLLDDVNRINKEKNHAQS